MAYDAHHLTCIHTRCSGFFFFFILAKPVSNLLIRPIGLFSSSKLIQNVVRRIISLFLILLGLYIFLNIAGLTQAAVAIISGTGLVGIIIGFAFKDIAENFISSLLLSVQRPFRLGDVIEVQDMKGVVDKVTARGTTLVDFDGNHIQIPNATIYKSVIKNFSANPWVRGNFSIGIGYDSSIQTSRAVIMEVLKQHEAVLSEPEPQVLVSDLGSSTVNLIVYFWIDGHKHATNKVASSLIRLSLRKLEDAEISMPDDAREVIFPQGISVTMEQAPDEPLAVDNTRPEADLGDNMTDDIGSDTSDILEQAKHSRDPEAGENII